MKLNSSYAAQWICRALLCISIGICSYSSLLGQITNQDITVIVEPGATFYTGGSYSDTSSHFSGTIEVGGLFVVGGDITSSNTTPIFKNSSQGAIILNGGEDEDQHISGAVHRIEIPTLQISKPSGEVVIANQLLIRNALSFTSGNARLDGGVIELYESAVLSGETNARRIYGSGHIYSTIASLSHNGTYANPHGMGVSFVTSGALNNLGVYRHHQSDNTAGYVGVANGNTVTRYFSLNLPGAEDNPSLSSLTINFLPAERGVLSDGGLAVYFSDDLGDSWLKLPTVSTPGATSITNTNVAISSPANNLFVIADAECSEAFKPSAVPTVLQGSPTIEPGEINVCLGDYLELSSSAVYYRWETNGTLITENNSLHLNIENETEHGNVYTLYERNARGCERAIAYTIDVLPLPVATFTHTPANINSCFGDELQFDASTSSTERGDLTIVQYDWAFDDNGATGTSVDPTFTFSSPGTYNVELIVTNQYGCQSINERANDVVVNTLPVPDFEFINLGGEATDDACEYEEFTFINTSTYSDWMGNTGDPELVLEYEWDYGDGATATGWAPTHHYTSHGTKTVSLTARVIATGCSATITKQITVDPRPEPDFHFETDTDTDVLLSEGVCEGINILFANTSTIADDTPLSHFWDFGDGATSTDPSPVRHYSQEGIYTVTLEVTSDTHGCVHLLEKQIVIHPTAEGHFQMKASGAEIRDICEGADVFFDNQSHIPGEDPDNPLQYLWEFGDGTTSTLASPTHAFSEPRLHVVKLTRTSDRGCVNSVSRQLFVHATPVADFVAENACDGQAVAFASSSYVVGDELETYAWNFGDGATSFQPNPEHLYDGYGTYNVSLTVTSEYVCSASIAKDVVVYRNPQLNLGSYALSCSGSLLLDAIDEVTDYPATGGSFTWKDKTGAILGTNQTLEVSSSGVYYLTVATASPENCEASFSVPVYILEPGELGPDRTSCEGAELDATPSSVPPQGSLAYIWTKDGVPLAETTAKLQVTESGAYEVTVTYTLNGLVGQPSCSYTDVVNVLVNEPPSVDLGPDIQICAGSGATLSSNVVADSYQWTNVTTGEVLGTAATQEVSEGGEYQLTVTEGTCVSSDMVKVEELPLPEAGFVASDSRVCPGEEIAFTNLSYAGKPGDPIVNHFWDFGDGATSSLANPAKSYTEAGLYNVTLQVTTQNGCMSSYQQEIRVDPLPVASFTVNSTCEKSVVSFTNHSEISDGTNLKYKWTFGDGSASTQAEPSKIYHNDGIYTVTLEVTSGNGCKATSSQSLEIYPNPEGSFLMEVSGEQITKACVGEGVSFVNESFVPAAGSPLSYMWDFGDGNTSTAVSPVHFFANAGSYTISLTRTTATGCENTISKQLLVNPLPEVAFAVANVCEGVTAVFNNSSSVASGSIQSYLWDFGDGSTSTLVNPSHSYTPYGEYEVTLTAISSAGCTSSATETLTIHRKPSFDIGEYGLSVTGSVTLDPTSDPDHYLPAGTSFVWKNGSGATVATTAAVTLTTSGNYSATVTTTPESCTSFYSIPVFIVTPGDLGADRAACEQTELNATPASTPSQGTLSYAWTKDGTPLAETAAKLEVTELGAYEVTVTYTLTHLPLQPSQFYTDAVNIEIETPPSVDLGPDIQICAGSGATLSSNALGDSYQWINVTTGEVLGTAATQEVSEGGEYQLTVTDGTCVSSDIIKVEELPLPEAGFVASDSRVCIGEEVSFTNLSYPTDDSDPIAFVEWDFGDGTTSVTANPAKTFTVSGTYTVTLQVTTDHGCVASFQQEIVIEEPPAVGFTSDGGCQGSEVVFSNTSTSEAPLQYTWDFGDDTSEATNPSHIFNIPGTHIVTLTAFTSSCEASFEGEIEILPIPPVDFNDETTTCGTELVIDGGADMTEYRWYDVESGATLSTERYFTATENGAIGFETTNSHGCTVTDETYIILNTPVTIDLGDDRNVCGTELLDAGSFPGVAYQWSTGDDSRIIEAPTSGTYSVSIIDQNGCEASDEVTITVVALPIVDLGSDVSICSGETVTLDAGNAGMSYVWSTGATSRTITVSTGGIYEVEVFNGVCSVSDEITVNELTPPTVDFSYTGICVGESLQFSYTGVSTVVSYLWDFGDGTQSVKADPQKSFSVAQSYEVRLEVTNAEGCKSSVSKTVVIQPRPSANFSFTTACEETEVVFANSTSYSGGDGLSYEWDFGDGGSSEEASPAYVYGASGSYTVKLRAYNGSGCVSQVSKSITVRPKPVVDLGGYKESCEPALTLDAENGGSSFKWSDNSTGQQLTVSESGLYGVRVTTSEGCVAYDTVEVKILRYDVPVLGEDKEGCGEVALEAGVSSASYLWSTGSSGSSIEVNKPGSYWVQTISEDLCIRRDSVEVVIHPIPVFSLGADVTNTIVLSFFGKK